MTPSEQIRDFIPVEEVAWQLLIACQEEIAPGKPLVTNLGTGRPRSLRDFAEECWAQWQAPGKLLFGAKPYRAGEVMSYVPSLRKSQ
jgi:nucleoside-diphosphate-sugar epimerase